MAALNFPTTGLVAGVTQYTSDLGTTYIWDGVKWVGHSAGGSVGTNSIANNGHTVQVDSGGNLVLPEYTLPNTVGTVGQVLKWPASGSTLAWANDNNSGGSTYSNANVASYLVSNPQSGTYSNTNVAAYLTGNITAGNVRATQYNFANGVNILSTVGGGNANTGDFTFDADTITNGDGLILATNRGTLAIGTNMETPGVAGHFHIAFDGSNTNANANDLFLGDDYNYVKLPGYELTPTTPFGVEIGANDRDGGDSYSWRFGTDGNLQLPQGSTISDQAESVDITVGRTSNNPFWYNLFGDTGATGNNYANTAINGSVVHDAGGNVYVLGSTIDWNNGLGSNNLFLKYSPLGNLLWRRTWTDDNGLNCGSYNASLRYIEANVDLGTQDTILWAAQVPWDRISYIGTMDMEGNLVDQFGNARLPTRLDNFAVTDLEWTGNIDQFGDSTVTVAGQQYLPGPGYHFPAVASVDLANAAVYSNITVMPDGTNLNYGDPNNSPEYVNQFKAVAVIPAWQSNPATGALVGTYYDGTYSHAMVVLSDNGPPLTYGIGVDNYSEDNIIGEDICADANGNVYVIVNNLDSNYATLIKASAVTLDNGFAVWQLALGSEDPNDNFYATAVAYDNGHVYVLGQFYQDNINDTDAMLIKVAIYSGNIVWSRRIGSSGDDGVSINFLGGAGWESSSGISVYDNLITISFATEAQTPGLGGPPELNTVTLQYPTDGSITGTYGDFVISDFVPAHESGDLSITTLTISLGGEPVTDGFATLQATTAAVGTGWTNTQWDLENNREVLGTQTFKFMADGTFDTKEIRRQGSVKITANTMVANATPSTWTFQNNDGLRFPDGSVQYGAYIETEMALDGGSAVSVYNIVPRPLVADGGGSSSRFGVNDPVYDGSGGDNYVLDGGGA
jgi:hypothetical protein